MACPICSRPTDQAYRPFCSKRCADRDLAKWFSGSYAIPDDTPADPEALDEALQNPPDRKPH